MRSNEVEAALIKSLAIMGQEHDDIIIDCLLSELTDFPDESILLALKYCRRTLRHRIYLADIIENLPENVKAVGLDSTGRFQVMSDGTKKRALVT